MTRSLSRPARWALPRRLALAVALLGGLVASGCGPEPDVSLPSADEVDSYYTISAEHAVEMNGNVAEIIVQQSPTQLRRGGSLWARMGPYIYLFTDGTQQLFTDFGGLAGVRVITRAGNTEVARATLARTALNSLTWRRTLNIAGRARRDGGTRLTLLEDLIDWGEDHTEFEYNTRYTSR